MIKYSVHLNSIYLILFIILKHSFSLFFFSIQFYFRFCFWFCFHNHFCLCFHYFVCNTTSTKWRREEKKCGIDYYYGESRLLSDEIVCWCWVWCFSIDWFEARAIETTQFIMSHEHFFFILTQWIQILHFLYYSFIFHTCHHQ